jgi:NADH:ubiquinone oxidoreductase subunit F (NADH-binding)
MPTGWGRISSHATSAAYLCGEETALSMLEATPDAAAPPQIARAPASPRCYTTGNPVRGAVIRHGAAAYTHWGWLQPWQQTAVAERQLQPPGLYEVPFGLR